MGNFRAVAHTAVAVQTGVCVFFGGHRSSGSCCGRNGRAPARQLIPPYSPQSQDMPMAARQHDMYWILRSKTRSSSADMRPFAAWEFQRLRRAWPAKWMGYDLLEGRKVITAPTIALATPPKSKHSVLLVGAPVKIREIPELAESDALKPKATRMMPTTSKAMPIPLFIFNLSF